VSEKGGIAASAIRAAIASGELIPRDRLERIVQEVNRQAEDEALWFIDTTMPEAYLQQELRHLHALIESAIPETEKEQK
jgi:hypothetical protein